MTRIRIVIFKNTVALVTLCCCISSRIQASFESQRLMSGVRNREKHSIPSIFAMKDSNRNRIKNRTKKKDKKQLQKVQPLKMVSTTSDTESKHQLTETIYDSQGDVVDDEKSSRQKDQTTTTNTPSSSPSTSVSSNNNKNADGKQKSPVVSSTTFTLAPVAVPVVDTTPTSNAPVRSPTILSVPLTLPTKPPTNKPIVSVPLSVATSSAPTTFFAALTDTPTTMTPVTPSPTINTNPTTTTTTTQPNPVPIISPIVAPISSNGTIISGQDIVLGNEQSDAVADGETTNTTSHGSGAVTTGTIVGIVFAVIVSMIISVTVMMARHKYVQKHGAASTRRRKSRAQQKEIEISGIDLMDSEMIHGSKTVHIITSQDNDTANDISPDRTYEIHLEDDPDNDNENDGPVYFSQESSFLSTSGGEELDSDLDRNI